MATRPRPSPRRQVAVVGLHLVVLFLVVPVVAVVVGLGLAWAIYLPTRNSCPDPCDGPGMIGFGTAPLLVLAVWTVYGILLVKRLRARRSTRGEEVEAEAVHGVEDPARDAPDPVGEQ